MTVKELIEELKKCNPDLEITVFDEDAIPYKVMAITVDHDGNGELSSISIERLSL